MRRSFISAATATAMLMAVPAAAHVTVQPTEELVGSFARFVVRVPNERDDASTTRVEVQFPPLAFVSLQDAPGWKRTVKMQTLDEPLEVFGEQITEAVGTVTWSGGGIEPGEFEEFGFSARMPDQATTLEFPAIQTYDSGEVVRWIGPPDSEEPAALLASVDLGGGAEQGELAVLAELVRRTQAEPEGGADSGVLLGWIAIAVAVAALAVALLRRRT